MPTLTEQIREIVKGQNVSTYAIAKKIGISETLVARFLSGERGLSFANLDKLASMFGIVAMVGTQALPRPTKRGRKPKEKKMNVVFRSTFQAALYWSDLAVGFARDSFENNFSSRRGVFAIVDAPTRSGQAVCLYNNNPYNDLNDGRSLERDRETEAFRAKLSKLRVKELAYGIWPSMGDDSYGYSYAMILDANEDQMQTIKELMESVIADARNARKKPG